MATPPVWAKQTNKIFNNEGTGVEEMFSLSLYCRSVVPKIHAIQIALQNQRPVRHTVYCIWASIG